MKYLFRDYAGKMFFKYITCFNFVGSIFFSM